MTAAEIYNNAGMFFPPPPSPQLSAEQIASAPEASGVYFLYESDRLIYVGESLNVRKRLSRHNHLSRFDSVGVLLCDAYQRKRIEAFYIGLLDPPLNHQSTFAVMKLASAKRYNRKRDNRSLILRRILDYIKSQPGCSKTDVHSDVAGWKFKADLLDVILARMAEWRLIEIVEIQTPGRPRLTFYAAASRLEAVA